MGKNMSIKSKMNYFIISITAAILLSTAFVFLVDELNKFSIYVLA